MDSLKDLKSIVILGRKWTIKKSPKVSLDGEEVDGYCDAGIYTIFMDSSLSEENYQHVLCHEISHCIFFTFGGDQTLTNMETEVFCQSFGSGFSDLITEVLRCKKKYTRKNKKKYG